jgi:hypothetical protein
MGAAARDRRYATAGETETSAGLAAGDRVWLGGKKQPWTVRARGSRYIICTKPFNPKRSVLYTIIDLELGIRGTDDCVGSLGYETDVEIAEAMRLLEAGEFEISVRNNVTLDVDRVERHGGES